MAILVIFWSIKGDRMDNLGLIDFKIGLYVKVTVNSGQNKFGQNGHQLAKNTQIGRCHFGAYTLNLA